MTGIVSPRSQGFISHESLNRQVGRVNIENDALEDDNEVRKKASCIVTSLALINIGISVASTAMTVVVLNPKAINAVQTDPSFEVSQTHRYEYAAAYFASSLVSLGSGVALLLLSRSLYPR